MPFNDTPTLSEDKKQFLELRGKFHELLTKYGYPDNDGRNIILSSCCNLFMSSVMNMSLLESLDKKIISEEQARKLLSNDLGDFHASMMVENDIRRISFVTNFQFQIETLFKIILSSIGENVPRQYYDIVTKLLSVLQIHNSEEKIKTLNILAYVRNCLHSNGIHTNQSKEFTLDGYTFRFEKNKPFNQARWAHIYFVVINIHPILEEILDSQLVQSITPPIPYTFSTS